MSTPRRKPQAAKPLPVTLVRRERVTPGFVRVTLGGAGLSAYEPLGDDQWFRLFLPHPDGQVRTMAMDVRSVLAYSVTPPSRRPLVRNYTTWAFRPEGPEMDVDVFADGHHSGPGLDWLENADLGSEAALLDEGCLYRPPADVTRHLLVGDESALPALLGILRDAPADWRGDAIIEVADPADRRDVTLPAGATLQWVARAPGRPGEAAAEAAEALAVEPLGYAYLAGPAALVKRLRRHLVAAGLGKPRIDFTGYWREGRAAN